MSTGIIIVLTVVAVIAVAAALVAAFRPRMRGGRPGRRFGPEYERVVSRYGGDRKAAKREPERRLTRYDGLGRARSRPGHGSSTPPCGPESRRTSWTRPHGRWPRPTC